MSAIGQFGDWLATTPASQMIQNVSWIVPATQTLHILALSSVFFLMVVFDLRIMGVLSKPAAPDWAQVSLRWLWWGLGVLAVSGLVLIIGEPRRELMSWPFRIKMLLVVAVALLTIILSRLATRELSITTKFLAGAVLACWTLIIICGRWIAYINWGEEDGL